MSGRRAGKATKLARQLAKPILKLEFVNIKCPVPTCKGKSCLRLSSPYCFKHTLMADPGHIVSELNRVNSEVLAIQEVLLRFAKARKK